MHPDARPLAQVGLVATDVANGVEQRHEPPAALGVDGLTQQARIGDHQPGLLLHLPAQSLLDRLAVFNRSPETRPTPGVGDARLVVAMMQQQPPIVSHDQQHRRPSPTHRPRRYPARTRQPNRLANGGPPALR